QVVPFGGRKGWILEKNVVYGAGHAQHEVLTPDAFSFFFEGAIVTPDVTPGGQVLLGRAVLDLRASWPGRPVPATEFGLTGTASQRRQVTCPNQFAGGSLDGIQ